MVKSTSSLKLSSGLQEALMTKAEFEALAEERKRTRAGSGFDDFSFGRGGYPNINEGITCNYAVSNRFRIGDNPSSPSKPTYTTEILPYPVVNINGTTAIMKHIASSTDSWIELPEAPTVTHADASNSGIFYNGKFETDVTGYTGIVAEVSHVTGGGLLITNNSDLYNSPRARANAIVLQKGITTTIEVFISNPVDVSSISFIYDADAALNYQVTYPRKAVPLEVGYNKIEITPEIDGGYCGVYFLTGGPLSGSLVVDYLFGCPSHEISRSDLVFVESWHEDISEKDIVYPYGNIQYQGADTDGLSGILSGTFTGKDTYSLFGNWQAANLLVGFGYQWSTLTEDDRIKFVSNPENNCYRDNDKVIQVRYRFRVVQGLGDNWTSTNPNNNQPLMFNYNSYLGISPKAKKTAITQDIQYGGFPNYLYEGKNESNVNGLFILGTDLQINDYAYNGKGYAIPIALVHRRNKGAYHPKFNPNGTKMFYKGNIVISWSASNADGKTANEFATSISSCFTVGVYTGIAGDADGYDSNVDGGAIAGSVARSGRPDTLYYDQIHESDIIDLRKSSEKITDYKRILEKEFSKAVVGTTRGIESEWEIVPAVKISGITSTSGGTGTGYVYLYNGVETYLNGFTDLLIFKNSFNYGRGGMFIEFKNSGNIYSLRNILYNDYKVWTFGIDLIYADVIQSGILSETGDAIVYAPRQLSYKRSNTLLHCDIIGNPESYYRGQTYTNIGELTPDLAIGDVIYNMGDYTWATTGTTQNITTTTNGKVYYEVASGTTGIGTVGYLYVSKNSRSIDLDTEDFTNITNWDVIGPRGNFFKVLTAGAAVYLPNQNYTNVLNYEDLGSDWDGAGTWRTGIYGTPLLVGENGEDYRLVGGSPVMKLSRKAIEKKACLYSDDYGVSWTVWSLIHDATENTVSLGPTPETHRIILYYYTTHTDVAQSVTNSNSVIKTGNLKKLISKDSAKLVQSLLKKVPTASSSLYRDTKHKITNYNFINGELNDISHNNIGTDLIDTTQVKVAPFIGSENSKAYLYLPFKEMKFDVTIGDDSKLTLLDDIKRVVDDNGNWVLNGIKRIELPYFIEEGE